MLHEILLSLSGYQSEIFDKVKNLEQPDGGVHTFTSEPEQAMLESLAHIARLHAEIKQAAARISSSHPSVVCRSIASATSETHLGAFRRKIIEVEASILQHDSGFVGGYRIVPLSTIVGEFTPWSRRLEWLLKLMVFTQRQGGDTLKRPYCTSKDMLDFLQAETHTGYGDLEEMATSLLITGEKVWMRSLASWILYGKLPVFGKEDFIIQQNPDRTSALDGSILDQALLPAFVSQPAAESILAIGNALCQLQAQRASDTNGYAMLLLPRHLQILESLQYPLNQSIFQLALEEIDSSISQHALSRILPLEQITGLLDVIHRFVLLGNGEFAMALIERAAEKVLSRRTTAAVKPVRKVGRVDDFTVKEVELNSVLSKTWDGLAVLQSDQALDDESFNLARTMLTLASVKEVDISAIPLSTIMPNPTSLNLSIAPDSTLKLFLSASDVLSYSAVSAYLLSIRRTALRLSQLWKLTPHRRCHPTPLGPPVSASPYGQAALATRRGREQDRATAMRPHWATTSKALFVVNELDAYLHGEVIHNSWDHFQNWLHEGSRPGGSRSGSRPGTASSAKATSNSMGRSKQMNDPRTLARGHHAFLGALYAGLLLDNAGYVDSLKSLLATVDHYAALFSRLSTIWSGLDLQEDEGVVDAFSNYKEEEKTVMAEMLRSRRTLEEGIGELVRKLKDAERLRNVNDVVGSSLEGLDLGAARGFVPWKGRNMERLVLKLDYLAGRAVEDEVEKIVDDFEDD